MRWLAVGVISRTMAIEAQRNAPKYSPSCASVSCWNRFWNGRMRRKVKRTCAPGMATRCSSRSSLHSWSRSRSGSGTAGGYPRQESCLVVERVLTERELNRALLARQLLLERADVPVPRALERIGGLQTQDARSGYIGLWSRLAGFERDHLTRALERK